MRATQQAVEMGRAADATSTAALTGQGSVTDVVLAISRAELALQTATAVRDRVVSAYQEMMRMPI
jgi:flagellar hook-basal body complex protein FliE